MHYTDQVDWVDPYHFSFLKELTCIGNDAKQEWRIKRKIHRIIEYREFLPVKILVRKIKIPVRTFGLESLIDILGCSVANPHNFFDVRSGE